MNKSIWRAVAAAFAILAFSSVAAAPKASASLQACNYDQTFNACVRFDDKGYLWWSATAGIDVHMPRQYAQEIIDCGTSSFHASLWGDDGGGNSDDFISNLPLVAGWPVASANDLSAELTLPFIYSTALDEDDPGEDEVYAKISYYDCHTRLTQNFRTGVHHGFFGW